MISNEEIEMEIREKGLTAPRITEQDLHRMVASVQYHVFPGTNTTACCLQLHGGFTVLGEAHCVSAENFDVALGQKIAYDDAINKLWPLEGYRLHVDLRRRAEAEDEHMGVSG